MAEPVTTDNINDSIQRAVKYDMDEIKRLLREVKEVTNQDLQLDKGQKTTQPGDEHKLTDIYTKMDEVKAVLGMMQNDITLLKQSLQQVLVKISEQERR